MPTASDLLVAEIVLRAKRATEAEVAECLVRQEEQSRSGKRTPLGQFLIRARKLSAEEFARIARRIDEPLIRCPACGAAVTARALDDAPAPVCRCGARLDVEKVLRSLPDDALAIPSPEADPLAAAGSTSGRIAILGGHEKARGRRFGRYEILETIGLGAMGVVYRARHLDLERHVALKVLREGEGAREEQVRRFIREAQAAARLQHPNIVAIHEVGVEEGIHYFTMDFVEGETLHDRFQRLAAGAGDEPGAPPPARRRAWAEMARLIATIAHALHYAHQRGIVHRDLKPGNILITTEGVPKITDFGLAKTIGGDMLLTRSGAAVGTPLYMAPEQARGDLRAIDGRSDVFSLGVLLYQALAGVLPFSAESHIELYNKILYEEPDDPRRHARDIPRDLRTVCLKALEKRPRDRYQSAEEMAEDLERAARGEPILARPLGPIERVWRAAKRHRTVALVFLTAVVVAAAGWWVTLRTIERRSAQAEADARARAEAEARRLRGEVGAALRAGRPEDALERAAVLFARFPGSPEAAEARLLEGEAHLALGRTREALAACARAYRRAGSAAERLRALSAIADAFIAAGDHDRALAALEKLLQGPDGPPARPAAARAHLRAAKLLAELDDTEGARLHLDAAAAGGGGPARGHGEAAPSEGSGEAERAEADDLRAWLDDLAPAIDLAGAEAGATGDVDGDGRPELILVREGMLVALAPGPEGPLVEVARASVAGRRAAVFDVIAADVDGDGRADAIVAAREADAGPELLVCSYDRPRSRGRGEGGERGTFEVVERARLDGRLARGGIAAGDVDGDGRADIVVATAASGVWSDRGGGAGGRGGVVLLRSAREGGFQRIPVATELSARGAAALAVLVSDLDRDGRAEIVVGTGGATGDDVRIYRWNKAAGGLDVEWRQRVGPVGALLAADFDGDGAIDLAVGRAPVPPSLRQEYRYLEDGLHLLRPVEPARSYAPEWADSAAWPGAGGARHRSLAAGDIAARGAASLVALFEPARTGVERGAAAVGTPAAADDRLVRVVAAYTGFGGTRVARRLLVFRDRAVEWLGCADLDADGDAELIVGGPAMVRVYGLRGR